MDEARWPAEWLRGVLEVCVLGVLSAGATYGYAISQALEAAGMGTVKGGTLYPLLGRLEAEGLVEATWAAGSGGPGRKYFALTPEGLAALAARARAWEQFVDRTRRLLPSDTRTTTPEVIP